MTLNVTRAMELTLAAMPLDTLPKKPRNPNLSAESIRASAEEMSHWDMADDSQREKANRYLGWTQGVAEGKLGVDAETLRQINLSCAINPVPGRGDPSVNIHETNITINLPSELPDLSDVLLPMHRMQILPDGRFQPVLDARWEEVGFNGDAKHFESLEDAARQLAGDIAVPEERVRHTGRNFLLGLLGCAALIAVADQAGARFAGEPPVLQFHGWTHAPTLNLPR